MVELAYTIRAICIIIELWILQPQGPRRCSLKLASRTRDTWMEGAMRAHNTDMTAITKVILTQIFQRCDIFA